MSEWISDRIDGIPVYRRREKFPDRKYRDVYRFTVPGWPECTVTGLSAAKRVIRGRTDPAIRNTLRIK